MEIKNLNIVKRGNHKEEYDSKKVYASVYAAVLNAHMSEGEAEEIAKDVLENVNRLVKTKHLIDSKEIKKEVIRSLNEINKEVSTLYEHHHNLC